jgi:hypothetical protein
MGLTDQAAIVYDEANRSKLIIYITYLLGDHRPSISALTRFRENAGMQKGSVAEYQNRNHAVRIEFKQAVYDASVANNCRVMRSSLEGLRDHIELDAEEVTIAFKC